MVLDVSLFKRILSVTGSKKQPSDVSKWSKWRVCTEPICHSFGIKFKDLVVAKRNSCVHIQIQGRIEFNKLMYATHAGTWVQILRGILQLEIAASFHIHTVLKIKNCTKMLLSE